MNEKLENQLQLALETPEEERKKTDELNVGYDSVTRVWELIVKYNGNLDFLREMNIQVEYLIGGYAILIVPENLVEQLASFPQIEYVEMPKTYYYDQMGAFGPAEDYCFPPVTMQAPFLSGKDVLIAILDSGIAYERMEFRTPEGKTRIKYIWDQTLDASIMGDDFAPPQGFSEGVEFDEEEINFALSADSAMERYERLPSLDVTGHGTAVAGIAAGYLPDNSYIGASTEARLLIVKLGSTNEGDATRTVEIMRGITYALNKAYELNMPLVINLSFGNSYGSHDGNSLLERFIDNASEIWKTVICIGSGNDGNTLGHINLNVNTRSSVEFTVANYERNLNLSLWKKYFDTMYVYLTAPNGERNMISNPSGGDERIAFNVLDTRVIVYDGNPTPYSTDQEIYMTFIPNKGPYIESGIWSISFLPVNIKNGEINLYMPTRPARNAGTIFLDAVATGTFTVPSTAARPVSVGAYNQFVDSYAEFSGRGFEEVQAGFFIGKPDLVAPGVNILAPSVYGGFEAVTGTSFATPIVTGAVALMMEWGIVRGNDPFLYGEKVKAYLRKGAQPLRGENVYPNNKVGYGKLCVKESIPI